MPISPRVKNLHPVDLFERSRLANPSQAWWALQTISRRENAVMRRLHARQIPYFCPMVERRYRSPNGRSRASYSPLFTGYVFLFGNPQARLASVESGHVSSVLEVSNTLQIADELQQIERMIAIGAPLTPESRIDSGDRVRVKSGAFAGFGGYVLRRESEVRLLVTVGFMEQGVSVLLDDYQLEYVTSPNSSHGVADQMSGV